MFVVLFDNIWHPLRGLVLVLVLVSLSSYFFLFVRIHGHARTYVLIYSTFVFSTFSRLSCFQIFSPFVFSSPFVFPPRHMNALEG